MAALVCGFMLAGCGDDKLPPQSDPALLQRAMELQRKVYALEQENQTLTQDASQAESLRQQFAENITEFERAKLERDKVRDDFDSLQRDYDELVSQLKPINELLENYEAQLRTNLEGEPLGDVELRDGRVLKSCIVEKVGNDWASLKHDQGVTNIEFNILPDYLQRKFSFRPAMVSGDSLVAQKPVENKSTRPTFSREDAANAMQEAMAAERKMAKQKQQDGYRAEILKLTGDIGRLKGNLKVLADQRADARREANRSRKIKLSKADQEKAVSGFDFKIQQTQREILAREARVTALKSMLEPTNGN